MIDEELSLLHLYLDEQEDDDDDYPDDDRDDDITWPGFHLVTLSDDGDEVEVASTFGDDPEDYDDWEPVEFDDAEYEVETEQDGY